MILMINSMHQNELESPTPTQYSTFRGLFYPAFSFFLTLGVIFAKSSPGRGLISPPIKRKEGGQGIW